ncbi:MAG: PP2C family protein-serine/threonine phosphatase [Acidimicrobiia bacterium]
MKYTWTSATAVGHVREMNEDSVYPDVDGHGPGPAVIAVADGMGGAVAGEVASRLAIAAAPDGGDAASPLARVGRGNRAVLEAVEEDTSLAGMGTTLTLIILHPSGTLEGAHVGDSRAYLYRTGSLEQITHDHTLVAEMIAQGRITPSQAATHPRRHLLTRVLGTHDMEADTFELEVRDGDRILLCSDGLTGMVSDRDISRLLESAADPAEAAWSLVEAANAAGGLDNTTVAVVDVAR